jgi:hypothetical protein
VYRKSRMLRLGRWVHMVPTIILAIFSFGFWTRFYIE